MQKINELSFVPKFMINLRTNAVNLWQVSANVLAVLESEQRYFLVDIDQKKALSNTRLEDISVDVRAQRLIKDGEYLFCLNSERTIAKVVRIIDLKEVNSFNPTKSLITVLESSEDGESLIIGGSDGKTFLFERENRVPKSLLTSHRDSISAITIDKKNEFVATAALDREIQLKNIIKHQNSETIHRLRSTPTALAFFKERYLVCGDKSGNISLIDFKSREVVFEYESIRSEVTTFEIFGERFMLVHAKSGKLFAFDLLEKEYLSDDFLGLGKRYSAFFYDKKSKILSLAGRDSKISAYSLEYLERELQMCVENLRFKDAYTITTINPFLKREHSYLSLEASWEVTYREALSLLEEGRGSEANEILRPYVVMPTKRMMIQKLIDSISRVPQMRKAIEQKRYSMAYSMASQYQLLKETLLFKKLEEQFTERLLQAVEYVRSGDLHKAQNTIFHFKSVTEKSIVIQSIFQNPKIFDDAIKSAKQRDYKEFFSLVTKCEAIKYFEIYKEIKAQGEELIGDVRSAIFDGRNAEALKLAKEVCYFPEYRKEALEIIENFDVIE